MTSPQPNISLLCIRIHRSPGLSYVGRTQLSKGLRSFTTTIGIVSLLRKSIVVQYSSKLHPVVESYSLV